MPSPERRRGDARRDRRMLLMRFAGANAPAGVPLSFTTGKPVAVSRRITATDLALTAFGPA